MALMHFAEAHVALLNRLEQAGLDRRALDPWETWRAFKSFLHAEVEGAHDAASVQAMPSSLEGSRAVSLYLVRQFSARDPSGDDVPVWHVTVELRYEPDGFPDDLDLQVWTHDFPTLEEFASVVEGAPEFQVAMARRPKITEVRAGEV